MKKLLSILLSASMLLASVTGVFAYSDTKEGEYVTEAANVLTDLGVVAGYPDGTLGADKDVTRAEAASFICHALGYGDIAPGSTEFDDVTSDYWAAGYIQQLYSIGVIAGYGDNKFGPEDKVTDEQMVTMLVNTLGCKDVAVAKPGQAWYTPYINLANNKNINILKNITLSIGAPASRGDVITMIYDVLDAYMVEPESLSIGDDGTYNFTEETFVEHYLEIQKIEGIVTAVPYTQYMAGYDADADDTIVIDEISYTIAADSANDYLGKAVYAWVTEDNEVLAIGGQKNKNNTLTINAADLIIETETDEETSKTVIKKLAYENGNKDIKISFDAEAFMGSVNYSELNDEFTYPEKGTITFINNDKDTAYDVALIMSYDSTMVVSDVDRIDNDILITTNDEYFDYDTEEETKYYYIEKNNQVASIEDIDVDDVISMIKGVDCYFFYVSSEVIEGTISASDTNDKGEIVYTIDDVEYVIADDLRNVAKPGDTVIAWIDVTGAIIDMEISKNIVTSDYGILMNIRKYSDYDETRATILFTDGTQKTYVVDEDCVDANKYLGAKVDADDIMDRVCSIKVSKKTGEITAINFLTTDNTDAIKSKDGYDAEFNMFGEARFDKNTIVFSIDANATDIEKSDITIGSVADLMVDEEGKDAELYTYTIKENANSIVDIVIAFGLKPGVSEKSDNKFVVVTSVSEVWNTELEEEMLYVKGYQNGKNIEFYLYDEDNAGLSVTIGDIILIGNISEDNIVSEIKAYNKVATKYDNVAKTLDGKKWSGDDISFYTSYTDEYQEITLTEKTYKSDKYYVIIEDEYVKASGEFDAEATYYEYVRIFDNKVMLATDALYTVVDMDGNKVESVSKRGNSKSIFGNAAEYNCAVIVRKDDKNVITEIVVIRTAD